MNIYWIYVFAYGVLGICWIGLFIALDCKPCQFYLILLKCVHCLWCALYLRSQHLTLFKNILVLAVHNIQKCCTEAY